MSFPRFLTNYGLGYYRGGFPAGGFDNDAAMIAQYPLADSNKLRKLGADHMYDYIPGQWVYEYHTDAGMSDADLLIPFTAANGARRVVDSRNEEIHCPKAELVYQRLAVSGAQNAVFHPTFTTASHYSGKFFQYNDEDMIWQGLYAGVRAKLYDNWTGSGLPDPIGYTLANRDTDTQAWECAVEGITAVFGYLRQQLPGSRWAIHLVPSRPQRTDSLKVGGISLTDMIYGQSGSGGRWRGIGSTGEQLTQAQDYADLWMAAAQQAYQPIANQSDWLCPRLYIDDRMRNWDQEVPGQLPPFGYTVEATAAQIRESWLSKWEDQVDLCNTLGQNKKPVYPAICSIHAGSGNNVTSNTNIQDWYLGLNVDLESHREQMRRILDKVTGVSYWSSDENQARLAFSIGQLQLDVEGANPTHPPPPGGDVFAAGYTMNETVKMRVRTQRRFPGVFSGLHPHPDTQAGEAAWRTVANWEKFHAKALEQIERTASASTFLGSARQTTLTSLSIGPSNP